MKKYRCTAQHPFDSFRLWFFGAIIFLIVFLFFGIETYINVLLASALASLLLNSIIALLRIIRVSTNRNKLIIKTLSRTKTIEGPFTVETWWMYEITESYDDNYEETWGRYESRPTSNYLKLCANIKGKNGSILLCETIKMQGKFPNDHPYRYDLGLEDLEDAFTVWDVDNCLKALRLSKMCTTSHLVRATKI